MYNVNVQCNPDCAFICQLYCSRLNDDGRKVSQYLGYIF
jgi:hypothetical protein